MTFAQRLGAVILTGVALIASACGGGTATPSGSVSPGASGGAAKTVKVWSSLPMTGSSRTQTVQIVNAIKMALEEINSKVGNTTIQFEALDDATAAKQSWDAAQESENAKKAIADKNTVAYIGTFNSGAAKVSIPLLCQAGIVMISPANTYPGLTKPGKGEADEPGKYYQGCTHNYFRVVPADDIQGAVGAVWMQSMGVKKVYIVHDTQLYGKGIADVFRNKWKSLGGAEAGYEGAEKADNYKALANKIKDSGADGVYYGGIVDNNPAVLLADIRKVLPNIVFMGPDGINCSEFLKAAGPNATDKTFSTFGGLPPEKYTGKAADWLTRYKAKFGGGNPDAYAIYGYEAALVVINAIKQAGDSTSASSVLKNVAATKDFDGVLGKWSFDANGDTSLTTMSGTVAKSGEWSFVKELAAQ
jgi:branched-chain amino acid transport system substrate-binding protein